MELRLTEQQINNVKIFGGLSYSVKTMVETLDLNEEEAELFEQNFEDENSQISKAYQRGKTMSVFAEHAAILKKAQKGDIKALDEIKKIRRNNNY